MALSVRRITEVRIDNDTRSDEMRTVEMFSRWRPDTISGGRGMRHREDRHPGERVLNTLIDRGPLTAAMALRLADWVDTVQAWANGDLAAYRQVANDLQAAGVTRDQAPSLGSLGNPLVMADAIIQARVECLDDIAEFRDVILGPILAAFGADELEAARQAEVEKTERQTAKAER